jgi:hypothetical protein
MFGESDTGESPRVASPWEAIISTPPSPKYIPKLVPEAEEGNVEYKLQLLHPSPARFARLVTQLKWRLLEGGGQAYYELGVADSGALVGLGRAELERTLETLECMAGEIGASVVVVREIEVPKGLGGGRERLGGKGRERWEGDSTTTTDEDDISNSPSPLTLDTSPGLFAMDPEPSPSPTLTFPSIEYTHDLEISTVYKPRPTRLSSPSLSSSTTNSRSSSHTKPKWYPKKKQFHQNHVVPNGQSEGDGQGRGYAQTKQQAKALHRRLARDKRREEKRRAAGASSTSPSADSNSTSNSDPTSTPSPDQTAQMSQAPIDERTTALLVEGLESLHVTVDSSSAPVHHIPIPIPSTSPPSDARSSSSPTVPIIDITSPTSPTSSTTITNGDIIGVKDGKKDAREEEEGEVRLIVEALVVRKLSIEEAFLDFGGFSLV